MKTTITILVLLISIQIFGQEKPEFELKKIFYSLPIESELEVIIDSAKTVELIKSYENSFHNSGKPYLTGHIAGNKNLRIPNVPGQIEIFRSGQYTLWGTELDSLDVIYLTYNFGDKISKNLKKEYKRLVRYFKKETEKNEKYKLYADPGLIGYGYCFFKSINDTLPFMAIEIGMGDCVTDAKSLNIEYYKID